MLPYPAPSHPVHLAVTMPAGGCRPPCHSPASDNPAHGRIICQPVGIVHVLVSGKSSKHGLTDLGGHGVAAVLAAPGVGEHFPSKFGQAEGLIEFAEGEQPGVGGDFGAVELQLEATVESEPKVGLWRFTRRVFHPRAPAQQLSC